MKHYLGAVLATRVRFFGRPGPGFLVLGFLNRATSGTPRASASMAADLIVTFFPPTAGRTTTCSDDPLARQACRKDCPRFRPDPRRF